MKPLTLLCIITMIAGTCSFMIKPLDSEVIVFSQFWQEKTLTERPLTTIREITPDGLMLHNDTLLFVRTEEGSHYHFSVMNVHNQQWAGRHLPAGAGLGHSTGFVSYGLTGQSLWVYDLIKDNLVIESVDKTRNTPAQEWVMPAFYRSLQLVNDSMALGSGDYDAAYELAVINLHEGSITRQLAPYNNPEGNTDRAWKSAYESFLLLKPGKDKCVLAGRYSDQIEIVDLASGQSRVIRGPENYAPDLTAINTADGKALSARNYKTRFAFVKGKVTDRYIYLLYSGNNHESSQRDNGKYIYVFDWNGAPLQKITLSSYAQDFAVTKNDGRLYLYHPGNKQLSVADLTP